MQHQEERLSSDFKVDFLQPNMGMRITVASVAARVSPYQLPFEAENTNSRGTE